MQLQFTGKQKVVVIVKAGILYERVTVASAFSTHISIKWEELVFANSQSAS